MGRHVAALVRDVPVVEHPAQLLARASEELLLFGRKLWRSRGEQLRPVRRAGEQLAVPPHRAGFQGFALRLRHRWQQLQVSLHEAAGDQRLAQRPHVEEPQRDQQQPQECLPRPCRRAASTPVRVSSQQDGEGCREREQRQSPVGEQENCGDEDQSDDAADVRDSVNRACDEQNGNDRAEHGASETRESDRRDPMASPRDYTAAIPAAPSRRRAPRVVRHRWHPFACG